MRERLRKERGSAGDELQGAHGAAELREAPLEGRAAADREVRRAAHGRLIGVSEGFSLRVSFVAPVLSSLPQCTSSSARVASSAAPKAASSADSFTVGRYLAAPWRSPLRESSTETQPWTTPGARWSFFALSLLASSSKLLPSHVLKFPSDS